MFVIHLCRCVPPSPPLSLSLSFSCSLVLAFDIWGRTVDVANWMESEGVPDRVHVSQETYLRARTEGVLRFKKRETKIEFKEEKIQTYVKETVLVGGRCTNRVTRTTYLHLCPSLSISVHLSTQH